MEALEDCIPEVEEIPLIDSSADFDNDDDDDEEDVEEEHSFPNRGIKRLMSMGKSTQLSQVYESVSFFLLSFFLFFLERNFFHFQQ